MRCGDCKFFRPEEDGPDWCGIQLPRWVDVPTSRRMVLLYDRCDLGVAAEDDDD